MLIGISGKIGSGKDTVGTIIQYLTMPGFGKEISPNWNFHFDKKNMPITNRHLTSSYITKKFADTLKDIVCLLIGCTREQLEDREFKNTELGEEWWYFKGRNGTLISYTKDSKRNDEDLIIPTPRLLLQLLGTEAGRNIIHPNIWVNALFSEYKYELIPLERGSKYPNWIITDMRFPNELEAVKKRGGISIRVNRKPFKWIDIEGWETETGKKVERVEEHKSETALDNAEFDYVIENDSTIEDLIHTVNLILIKEKII
jgi:hypothetical protein